MIGSWSQFKRVSTHLPQPKPLALLGMARRCPKKVLDKVGSGSYPTASMRGSLRPDRWASRHVRPVLD